MTRRVAWTISVAMLLVSAGLLIFLWFYVASINKDIAEIGITLDEKHLEAVELNNQISNLKNDKAELNSQISILTQKVNLGSKTSVELRNTLIGDRDYFSILGEKYVEFCNASKLSNCFYFDEYSRLLISRLDAAALRLSASKFEDYKELDNLYAQTDRVNDCLLENFADAAIAPAKVRKILGGAKCASEFARTPHSQVTNLIQNIGQGLGITNQVDGETKAPPPDSLLSWSESDHLAFRVFALEGRAFANWKLGKLSEAEQFIRKAAVTGGGFTSVRLTQIKLNCAKGESDVQAKRDIDALRKYLALRANDERSAPIDKRNAQINLDHIASDFELYKTCGLKVP